jgi:UDP-N-acetylmuramate--alanine ligase
MDCFYKAEDFKSEAGKSTLAVELTSNGSKTPITIELQLPGLFNMINALQAVTVVALLGFDAQRAADTLKNFKSTKRRSEFIGEKNGVKYYDDYAHHPSELMGVIKAFKEWYPQSKLVVAFQPHTFSRTKALFTEFSKAFGSADEVVMIDIFASAREPYDSTITSTMLCDAINTEKPSVTATNFGTLESLAKYLKGSLKPGDVCLTVGAGDIYHLHELL